MLKMLCQSPATCDNLSPPVPTNEQAREEDQYNISTPTLPSSLFQRKRSQFCRSSRVANNKDNRTTARMRIVSALRAALESAIDRETDYIDESMYRKEFEALIDAFEGEQTKQSPTMIEASEKIIGLLFDVKEKLTNEEYLALTSACKTIHYGDAAITIGRAEDGRERTIYRSSLQNMQEFINNSNLARQIHGNILNKNRRLEELKSDPQADVSLIEKESSEVDLLKAKHRSLVIQAHCYLTTARGDKNEGTIHDSLMELVNYASLNLSYFFTLNHSRNIEKKRKIMHEFEK